MAKAKEALYDFVNGAHTKGTCMTCQHSGRKGIVGCRCKASWCPCHRTAFGHGGWTCNC
jgi:hypothetical protein